MLLAQIANLIVKMKEIISSGNPFRIAGAILGLILAAVTSFWF